jgi:hypothetical protein
VKKKLKELEAALELLQINIDNCTTPWEAERLEEFYTKLWREYIAIDKQLHPYDSVGIH